MKGFFKVFLGFMVFCFTVGLLAVAGGFWWAVQEYHKPAKHDQPIEVMINKGDNIGESLLYAGALDGVTDQIIFRFAGKITGQATKLKAGEYEIPAHASIKEILDLLESGKTILRNVTLREGLTSYEILNILKDVPNLALSPDLKLPAEGTVLPETYSFVKGESAADIVNRMQVAMTGTIDELWPARSSDLPLANKEEALILASIVEKETGVPEERARVAGVFINRLRLGMPLQTDPSVIYALNKGQHQNNGQGPLGRRLLKKDLEIDSPYNTYLYTGLPPTPICNPGRAAIEATLHPESHKFIYFVADGSGGHLFAETLAQHNENVANWRKIRKAQE